MTTEPTLAQLVMRVGDDLYGHHAVDRLADALPMAKRTVERIAKASREGADYPAARAALGELPRLIEARIEELNVLLDAVEDAQAQRRV